MKRVELLSSGELILVPGLWSDEARLQGTRGGPGAQADVAWGGAQGGRAAGPDRDTEQGSLPALGHPLRAADEVPEAVPFPHFEDHAGGASRSADLEAFTREAFVLYWEEGGAPKSFEEVDEDEPIREVARRIGRDPEEVLESATTGEAKEALKSATGEAVERGVFGAPTFFVGDEMFWGNDRLHFVEAALQKG